jgi:hypothetical protein
VWHKGGTRGEIRNRKMLGVIRPQSIDSSPISNPSTDFTGNTHTKDSYAKTSLKARANSSQKSDCKELVKNVFSSNSALRAQRMLLLRRIYY